ncbi:hypothetical protein Poli38472_003623 [Pythium oligandrum]|uniref:BED-type domain-containing protein n=1 Tax=Pythium oligandrum TaxID=41045 RepID=A0A8K1CP67_PYTOL|nr:hypothetical protein Poli38472_003623 [Pythium oligandrum]|eukprot:TMW65858.1 hypothetical protein Poli38472_003623 [Pythium oligandrum]
MTAIYSYAPRANALIVSFLYERGSPERPDERRCVVCGKDIAQQLTSGYSNLLHHLEHKHKSFRAVVEVCIAMNKMKATPDMFPADEGASPAVKSEVDATETVRMLQAAFRPAPPRAEHYTTKDAQALLSYLEEVLPTSSSDWDRVRELYNETYAKPNGRSIRPMSSIHSKYYNLLAVRARNDKGNPEVERARKIRDRIRELGGAPRGRPSKRPLHTQAFPSARPTTVSSVSDEQHSDDETIPDEEMAAIAAADPDFNSEPECSPSQQKRPRRTETNLHKQDFQDMILARMESMENKIKRLQRKVRHLDESLYQETVRSNALQRQLAECKFRLSSRQTAHQETDDQTFSIERDDTGANRNQET